MSHDHDDGLLAAYLDGALSDVERARLEGRLARDPALAAALAVERTTRDRAATLLDTLQLPAGRGEPPDLAALRARARRTGRGAPAGPTRFAPMAWAAALVGVIGVALAVQRLRSPADAVVASGTPATTAAIPGSPASAAAEVPFGAATEAATAAAPMVAAIEPAATDARDAAPPAAAVPGAARVRPAAPREPASPSARRMGAVPSAGAVAAAEAVAPAPAAAAAKAAGVDAVVAAAPPAPVAAQLPADAAAPMDARAERAARAMPGLLTFEQATAILGAAPWRIADARLVGIARMTSDAVGGAVATRDLLAFRFRDAAGRDLVLLQQRADGDVTDEGPAGWRTRDQLRVRLMGEVAPAARDSLWSRLRH